MSNRMPAMSGIPILGQKKKKKDTKEDTWRKMFAKQVTEEFRNCAFGTARLLAFTNVRCAMLEQTLEREGIDLEEFDEEQIEEEMDRILPQVMEAYGFSPEAIFGDEVEDEG